MLFYNVSCDRLCLWFVSINLLLIETDVKLITDTNAKCKRRDPGERPSAIVSNIFTLVTYLSSNLDILAI